MTRPNNRCYRHSRCNRLSIQPGIAFGLRSSVRIGGTSLRVIPGCEEEGVGTLGKPALALPDFSKLRTKVDSDARLAPQRKLSCGVRFQLRGISREMKALNPMLNAIADNESGAGDLVSERRSYSHRGVSERLTARGVEMLEVLEDIFESIDSPIPSPSGD